MGYIYSLKHPVTNEIKYIGQTVTTLENRLKRHIAQCKIGKSYVKSWVKSLLCHSLKPIICEIEKCDDSLLNSKEVYWISYYSEKTDLCNITNGGQGGGKTSKYARAVSIKIQRVIELVENGIKLKEAEESIGLPNGYLSRARRGEVQFIIDNNIIIPNLPKAVNNKNKVFDERTGITYTSQKNAAENARCSRKKLFIT